MPFRVATPTKLATLTAWRDALAGGALLCMSGEQPASTAAAVSEVDVVVSVPLLAGALATVGDFVTLTLDPAPTLSAKSGIVGWVRAVDSVGAVVFDADAGLPGTGAAAVFVDSLSIAVGGEVDPVIGLTL